MDRMVRMSSRVQRAWSRRVLIDCRALLLGGGAAAIVAVASPATAQTDTQRSYAIPPQVVVDILDASPAPTPLVSPRRDVVALLDARAMPGIAELARPMHRLAGYRINPRNSAPWRSPAITGMTLTPLDGSQTRKHRVVAPRGTTLGWPRFAPDGRHLSYAVIRDTGVELWVVDVSTGAPRPLTDASLNATWGDPCDWLADSSGVLCRFRMSARGAPPEAPRAPLGPNVQESDGRRAPVRTYQDLLTDAHDDALFEYHFTSQIATVGLTTGSRTSIRHPGLFARVLGAPDSQHLLVERLERPFSRLVPGSRFRKSIEVWNRKGEVVELFDLPVAEAVPIGGVATGPRAHRWNPTEPATLVWTEALDGGDPQARVSRRDRVLSLAAPFDGTPTEIVRTAFRVTSVAWTEDGTALVRESDRATRWTRTWLLYPGAPEARALFDHSAEDAYADPGAPLRRPGGGGASEPVLQDGSHIYLTGRGASPLGDRPFIDRLNVTTFDTERIFRTDETSYETVVAVLSSDGHSLLTRRESPTEPPNYVVRNMVAGTTRHITRFEDPTPVLRQVRKQLLTYERDDGVSLSATLYLPPGYRDGERRPLLMWAYPREYTTPAAASQVRGSPHRFTRLRGASHLLLLTQGYAVLDGPAMPIVGEGETANDTYVEQLVASAAAAIDAVVEMGVADRDRIAIGGHSYGAFMTANLLAHSDLFRAGIARSGAYNRTLTPFGFQNERRTFWEAPEVYGGMSPFFHAHKINEPILLMHGEIDNNSGTFPMQSERLYMALKGHGATVRYVTFPHESHGYSARESVLHAVAEMVSWCDAHVRNAAPTPRTAR